MLPVFEGDFVAYEDMKGYLIELIGLKNWLVLKLNGTESDAE